MQLTPLSTHWAPRKIKKRVQSFSCTLYNNILLFRYLAYIPAHVTATANIIPAVRMFKGQGTLSLPTPMCLSVQHSLIHYTRTTRIHSLFPHFTLQKSARLAHFAAHVQTESHPFHHLMGQGPLMLACLHAPAVHAPYSHGSISVPLLPLPNPALPLQGVSFLWDRGQRVSR